MELTGIFQTVVFLTVMGSIVVGLILFLKLVFRNTFSAKWHYYIWLLLIIRLLIPFGLESQWSIFNISPVSQVMESINHEPIIYKGNADDSVDSVLNTEFQANSFTEQKQTAKNGVSINYSILAVIWIVGVGVTGFYFILLYLKLLIKARKQNHCRDKQILSIFDECKSILNVKKNIPIIYDYTITTPFVFGYLRPKLLVSPLIIKNITSEEQKNVFLHELAHLKQKDILLVWVSTIIQIMHWFNPVVWYAFYTMRKDGEISCDAYVLSYLKPEERKSYGQTIIKMLDLTTSYNAIPLTTGFQNTKNIRRRIKMIAQFKNRSVMISAFAISLCILVGYIVLTYPISNNIDNNSGVVSNNIYNNSEIINIINEFPQKPISKEKAEGIDVPVLLSEKFDGEQAQAVFINADIPEGSIWIGDTVHSSTIIGWQLIWIPEYDLDIGLIGDDGSFHFIREPARKPSVQTVNIPNSQTYRIAIRNNSSTTQHVRGFEFL